MGDAGLIPWSEVHSWSCSACGRCCVGYRVPLKMDEYVRVANQYGYGVVEFGLGKVYLKHSLGDRCIFQHPSQGRWICALQAIKPLACKLFPFRVYSQPVYKRGDMSGYRYRDRTIYVYLDLNCPGIELGRPSERFLHRVLPEAVAIGSGVRWKQRYTTSKYISWRPGGYLR
ncbi:MAG: YkgJ family cysteine cluster protein [Candidatus Bathyarchaeia archaeon]